jgi:hypothetical protein
MWATYAHRAKANKKLADTHRVTTLKYKGWDIVRTRGAAERARIALDMIGVNCVGPLPLPRQRKLMVCFCLTNTSMNSFVRMF